MGESVGVPLVVGDIVPETELLGDAPVDSVAVIDGVDDGEIDAVSELVLVTVDEGESEVVSDAVKVTLGDGDGDAVSEVVYDCVKETVGDCEREIDPDGVDVGDVDDVAEAEKRRSPAINTKYAARTERTACIIYELQKSDSERERCGRCNLSVDSGRG